MNNAAGALAALVDSGSDPPLAPDLMPHIAVPPAHAPSPGPGFEPEVGDFRFRGLMSEDHWWSLPAAVRRRFSRRLPHARSVVYGGEVLETFMTRRGWLLAHLTRLVGGPLPFARGGHVPSVVTVTEDRARGGQMWTRIYARGRSFPQVIHSLKRFAGPTGLEEYVGCGVGMSLTVYARDGALVFRSKAFFLQLFGRRFFLPAWLFPPTICVTHAELPDSKFSFTLQIIHPRHGLMLRQMAIFRELQP
jgi:Domain of unknown function (DUF4166)